MKDMRRTVADLTRLVAQLSDVTAEQSRQLTLTQQTVRRTLSSIDSAKVDSTVKNLQAASAQLDALARDFKQTNGQVQGVLDKVSNGTGTAARLLNDPSVYARMDTLLLRVDSLMADLKRNPKKYINLRIF